MTTSGLKILINIKRLGKNNFNVNPNFWDVDISLQDKKGIKLLAFMCLEKLDDFWAEKISAMASREDERVLPEKMLELVKESFAKTEA